MNKNDYLDKGIIIIDNAIYSYRQIFENHKKNTMIGKYMFINDTLNRYFVLYYKDIKYYFYISPLKLEINNIIYDNIYCYNQISEILEDKKITSAYLKDEDTYIRLNPINLIKLLKKGIHEISVETKNNLYHSYNGKMQTFKLEKSNPFDPLNLSKYFYDYFKYNNKEEDFIYKESAERNLLLDYLNDLLIYDELFIFKFTGPKSSGKSTTLLYFSRDANNILYFNLSYLTKKEKAKDFVSCYNALMEEINRIYFFDDKIISQFKDQLKSLEGNTPWMIIENLFEFLYGNSYQYIFIFDQFKSKNVDDKIFNSLLGKIKSGKTNIKFVICSSANNIEIKKQYFNTINEYKGNPISLDEKTQNYYFYFNKLFYSTEIKQDKYYLLFKLFNFMQKYKKLFLDVKNNEYKKEFDNIDKKIDEKLTEFNSNCNLINSGYLNLYETLINVLEVLDKNIDYSDLNFYYDITPIKYFYFEYHKNFFRIHSLFEYIIIFIKNKFSYYDTNNFFKKIVNCEKNIFSGNIKGYYLEKSAINSIKNKNIIFEKDYEEIIKINEIVAMDYIVEDKINNAIKRIIMNDNSIINENSNENINSNNNNEDKTKTSNISLNKSIKFENSNDKNYDNNVNKRDNVIINYNTIIDDNTKNNEKKDVHQIDNKLFINKNNKIINDNNEMMIGEDNKKKEKENENEKNKLKKRLEKILKDQEDLFNSGYKSAQKLFYSKEKNNLLDINFFKNNLNNYQSLDNKKRILNNKYKNKSILIEQDKINGECIDMAIILNQDNKNKFIGFQMKFFRESTTGGNASNLSKIAIKNSYLDILKHSNDLLGIDIEEWHYIMVLYYNPNNLNNEKSNNNSEICKFLVSKCINNAIKYIFYCPENNLFYDSKKNQIIPNTIYKLLDDSSNLDYITKLSLVIDCYDYPKYDFINKKYLNKNEQVDEKAKEFNIFKSILKNIKCKNLDKSITKKKYGYKDFQNDFKKIINNAKSIKFSHNQRIEELEAFIPRMGNFFCFQGNNNDLLIIIRRNEDEKLEYLNLTNQTIKYNSNLEFFYNINRKQEFTFIFKYEKNK